MKGLTAKELAIFFAVLIVVVASFIIGINFVLKNLPGAEEVHEVLPEFQIRDDSARQLKKSQTPKSNTAPKRGELNALIPTVIYRDGRFNPERIIRDGSDKIGCLVILLNQSRTELGIGINPHNAQGADPGPDWGITSPGKHTIFDPRFVGITELTFHNHANPVEEFFIEFDPKCQL